MKAKGKGKLHYTKAQVKAIIEHSDWLTRRMRLADRLLENIKRHLPALKQMLERLDRWDGEDRVYRYYHNSCKVYFLQQTVQEIVAMLKLLSPDKTRRGLCPLFMGAVNAAMGDVSFKLEHNREWEANTRPFVDAYFHAEYFLRMAIKYGESLGKSPEVLPSGWAALLELYEIR